MSYFQSPLLDALQSAFQRWESLLVCGDPAHFQSTFDELLALQNQHENTIVFSQREVPPGRQCISTPEPLGSYLRAALRQDPDCIAIDRIGLEDAEILLTSMQTGHRVIFGSPKSAQETLNALLEVMGSADYAAGWLAQSNLWLLEAEGVFHPTLEGDKLVARAIFQRVDGVWNPTGASADPPPPPPPPAPEPMALPTEWKPRQEPLRAALERKLSPFRRSAWAPIFGEGPSQFGGNPRVAPGEKWPCCGDCGERMLLVTQVQLSTLPAEAQAQMGTAGFLQFFYCVSDSCSVESAWEPFQKNSLSRVLQEPTEIAEGADFPQFPYSPIASWAPLNDFPHFEDTQVELDDEEQTARYQAQDWTQIEDDERKAVEYSEYIRHFAVEAREDRIAIADMVSCKPGDKLLGWPSWSQGSEIPNCRECGKPMQMLLQINNDGSGQEAPGFTSRFGQIFAGDGNGHVTRCPDHPSEMTFAWACG